VAIQRDGRSENDFAHGEILYGLNLSVSTQARGGPFVTMSLVFDDLHSLARFGRAP
jgi:hypothetical protein